MKFPSITKTYGSRRVLDIPALELEEGVIHAVIGSNGSGKSTLARILAGVLKPDGGGVPWAGRVGYMPQRSYPFRMSVLRNLQLTGAGRDRAMAQLELDKGIAMVVCAVSATVMEYRTVAEYRGRQAFDNKQKERRLWKYAACFLGLLLLFVLLGLDMDMTLGISNLAVASILVILVFFWGFLRKKYWNIQSEKYSWK